MMVKELKSKPVTKKIYDSLKNDILKLSIKPKLVIIFIGDDPASEYYVKTVVKRGSKIGIDIEVKKFNTISQKELENTICILNNDSNVNGIMLQKPLPLEINEEQIIDLINPTKDVDGFNPINTGYLTLGRDCLLPCTPAAVLEMIKFYNIQTEGKHIVVLGRSDIVGKPLAILLLRKDKTGNATVTVCHSRTNNLSEITRQADILIAAIGKANFVTSDMLDNKPIIIDVGVNQITNSEGDEIYVGDVNYLDCFDYASAITPVPGGVGSVTTAMLLSNVVKACMIHQNNNDFPKNNEV